VLPVTSGTFAVVGAVAIVSVTVAPELAWAPPAGFWLMTSPAVTVLVSWVCVVTWNPA